MRLGYERFTGDGESSSLEINNEMVLEYNDWDENCIDPIVECSQFPFSDIVQSKNKTQLMDYCKAQYKPNVTKKTDYFIADKENQTGDNKADTARRYKDQGVELVIVTPEELMTILRDMS